MDLLQQAWHGVNDPELLVVVCVVFLWLAWQDMKNANAPMKDWKWDEYS